MTPPAAPHGLIDRLMELSIRQRGLVLLLTALFAVIGVYAASRVPIDAVPDVTNVQVQIITAAPALGPVDVEQYVSFPVETSMSGMPGGRRDPQHVPTWDLGRDRGLLRRDGPLLRA